MFRSVEASEKTSDMCVYHVCCNEYNVPGTSYQVKKRPKLANNSDVYNKIRCCLTGLKESSFGWIKTHLRLQT